MPASLRYTRPAAMATGPAGRPNGSLPCTFTSATFSTRLVWSASPPARATALRYWIAWGEATPGPLPKMLSGAQLLVAYGELRGSRLEAQVIEPVVKPSGLGNAPMV